MKSFSFLVVLAVVGPVAAGCGKTSDVGAAKAEALGLVQNYAPQFDDMQRRLESLGQRGNAVGARQPDAASASRVFSSATKKLADLRAEAAKAPPAITAAANQGKAQDLVRMVDVLRARFIHGYTEVFSDVQAVDSWIAYAEVRPTTPAAATPAEPTPAPAVDAPPASEPGAETHAPGDTHQH